MQYILNIIMRLFNTVRNKHYTLKTSDDDSNDSDDSGGGPVSVKRFAKSDSSLG